MCIHVARVGGRSTCMTLYMYIHVHVHVEGSPVIL